MTDQTLTTAKVLSISPDALEMIVQLRDQEPGDDEYGLSIAIRGVMGFQFNYDLAFVPLADRSENERVEKHGDLSVIIPESDVENLDGASLELTPQGLTMNNPNTPAPPPMAAPRGDLTGPMAEKVQQVLIEQVNPAIAAHGGAAELVSADEDTAYLRMLGGCQGCGMAAATLRQGIERILKDSIPELAAVVDVTDHESGATPFYAKEQ